MATVDADNKRYIFVVFLTNDVNEYKINHMNVNNKKIQEERMKTYFLDSAKGLLKAEGIKSISVRNVAYHAGYSYATLYNYFKDINDLLFRCVEDFCAEAEGFAAERAGESGDAKARLKSAARAYAEYFAEYPGVWELFFLERMGDFGNRKETAALITGLLDRICRPHLEECIKEGVYREEEAGRVSRTLHYMIPGMLLFYGNRLSPDTYADFMKEIDDFLAELLG